MKLLAGLTLAIFFTLVSTVTVWAVEPPNLISPASSSTTNDTTPTLSWNWSGTCVAAPASCYQVQLNNQNDFSHPYRDPYTSTTHYNPQLTPGIWYWRVKAKDQNGTWSPWSQVWSFVISESNPPAPPSPNPNPPANPPSQPLNLKLSLSEFLPNPAKDQKEWVEIYNPNNTLVDLTGWKLIDGSDNSKSLSGSIASGEYKVFEFSSGWLNNGGDSLNLINPSGTTLESYSYSETSQGDSFAKDSGGVWKETQTPTPGTANKITKATVLGSATNNVSEKTSSDLTQSLQETGADLLQNLTATNSAQATSSATTKKGPTTSLKTPPNIFLPVIFVGSGVFLILAAIIAYLIKIGLIRKIRSRKAKAPEAETPSA